MTRAKQPDKKGNSDKENSQSIIADWLVQAIIDSPLSLEEAVATLNLPDFVYQNQPRPLPFERYNQLFEWAAAQLGDGSFGLHVAKNTKISDLGILGYLIVNSSSIQGFCNIVEKFLQIIQRSGEFQLIDDKLRRDTVQLRYRTGMTNQSDATQDVEFTLAMAIKSIRYLLKKPDWTPEETFLVHDKQLQTFERENLLGQTIHYCYAYNAISFDRSLLDTPCSGADPQLQKIVQAQAEQTITADTKNKGELLGKVRWLIGASIGREGFTSEHLAIELGISRRTLHRQLSEQGASFKELRDQLLTDMAMEMLVETDADITEIGYQLGFSEVSAFSRCFKRLTGQSPREFRLRAQRAY